MANKKNNKKLIKILVPALVVVLIAVALVVVLLIPDSTEKNDVNQQNMPSYAEVQETVNEDNVHQVEIQKDEKGEVVENGTGTLLSYVPMNIKEIKVENTKSTFTIKSYTPVEITTDENGKEKEETQATEYTIVGFEDKDIAMGIPDAIANDAAALDFTQVVSTGDKDEKDFGFDSPQATVTVTYEDKTKAVIIVGNKAPSNSGVYVKFGDGKEIYLVEEDAVDSFLYSTNDLISLNVNDPVSNGDNATASSITLGGTHYKDSVTFEPSDNETANSNYLITSPKKYYGDDQGCSLVEAGIRGVKASSVAYVNPGDKELEKYGLVTPYATVDAVYPDTTVSLLASEPDSKGYCYLMVKGGDVIYKILEDSVQWVSSSLDDLRSKYFVDNTLKALSEAEVSFDNKEYEFDLETDSNNNTTVKCNDKEIELGDFQTAFDYMHSTDFYRHEFTSESLSGSPVMTVEFSYSGDRSDDEVKFYEKGNKIYVTVNGEQISYTYKTSVSQLKKLFTNASK